MAQTNYTPIQLYHSITGAAAPTSGNLVNGELAINITDGKLFYKDNLGAVQVLATKAGASGNVVGPASSTDNALVRFDSTTGKLVQNSVGLLSDTGDLTGLNSITLITPLGVASGGTGSSSTTFVNLATNVTGTLPVASGGTGAATLTANNVLLGNGTSAVQVVAPGTAGNVLMSNGTTWSSATPTPSSQVYPGAGMAVSTGTAWGTSKTTPTGDVVGTSDTQTLTNKTISGADNTLTVDGTNAVGFRNIPQNSQSAAYTLVLADAGKHILHPSTDANARTFTIPANSSVAYPIGTAVTFVNMTSQVVTIAITSDTLTLSPAGTSGSRSLAQYGSATALKIGSTQWLISGSGLT
jgi:hypothetical protein